MQTECSADLFGFTPIEGRKVVAAFDGGQMTSDAGAMLLGATDKQIQLIERFAGCFTDYRVADLVEHTVSSLVGQRVFGIALGYEDLIDHDQLRHDPVMAVLGGKLAAKRADCAALTGKSTLNRLELSREAPTRYYKISYDAAAIEGLFVDLFLDAHSAPPSQVTLDLDATDDPLHGQQSLPRRKPGRAAFFTAITTPTVIYRSMYSAAGICWRPNCARPISMPVPAASRRWRGSLPRSASVGPRCAFCCAAIRALPASP
jgi:Transposase DDE domain group 1